MSIVYEIYCAYPIRPLAYFYGDALNARVFSCSTVRKTTVNKRGERDNLDKKCKYVYEKKYLCNMSQDRLDSMSMRVIHKAFHFC